MTKHFSLLYQKKTFILKGTIIYFSICNTFRIGFGREKCLYIDKFQTKSKATDYQLVQSVEVLLNFFINEISFLVQKIIIINLIIIVYDKEKWTLSKKKKKQNTSHKKSKIHQLHFTYKLLSKL